MMKARQATPETRSRGSPHLDGSEHAYTLVNGAVVGIGARVCEGELSAAAARRALDWVVWAARRAPDWLGAKPGRSGWRVKLPLNVTC